MASPSCDAPRGRPLRRIVVLGSPGSGKTAFCHQLAGTTALPLYHLDDLYWSPGWSRPGEEEWDHRVRALCALPRWIADGNYADSAEPRARAADLVVLLDRHPLLCAVALVRRSLRLRRSPRGPGTAGAPPPGGSGRRRPVTARGPEYVPRRLRDSGDPPVLSLTALLRKALLFRRRDLVVIHDVLRRTGAPVRRCRTRRQAAALLAELGLPDPCPPSAPAQDRAAGHLDGGPAGGPQPGGPLPHEPGGRSTRTTVTPCTCPASATATSLWRST
ncbi:MULTISPECIES: hypothetical protein [unclassified Streptomyces]|uniref:hypothetical protein n=1 Tax=unclassified Streptomyces TaxID=2593676 RepID=UPI0038303768